MTERLLVSPEVVRSSPSAAKDALSIYFTNKSKPHFYKLQELGIERRKIDEFDLLLCLKARLEVELFETDDHETLAYWQIINESINILEADIVDTQMSVRESVVNELSEFVKTREAANAYICVFSGQEIDNMYFHYGSPPAIHGR